MARKKHRPVKSHHSRAERVVSSAGPSARSFRSSVRSYAFLAVLGLGVVLRLVVFFHMGYLNNDNHLEVIEYVVNHWTPARADQFNQAHHPPLYYFLAAPLLRFGGVPAVHGLSLILSIATLVLIASLLWQLPWIDERSKPWCLALAAFHPQFIMFGLFVSNDALAIFLGALAFYQCRRFQTAPSIYNSLVLGIWLGLGLLTKAVFLAFVLPLVLFVWIIVRQYAGRDPKIIYRLALFVLFATVLGSYKFVENSIYFANPMLSNLDLQSWAEEQRPTWIGLASLLDFNLLKLVSDPVISSTTVHSYPLMIYGSFWYSLIPESTFHGNLIAPFNRVGSMIYLVALCPTLLILIGVARSAIPAIRQFTAKAFAQSRDRYIYEGTLLLTFALNLLLILMVGWRQDAWSVFQGRLLFPSYGALLVAFSGGMEWAACSRLLINSVRTSMVALLFLFLLYLVIEIWLANIYPQNPLSTYHMPYTINMHAR
jgi:4-amino-4-deoxy-L-arabinose transferase-like glycosyltransferase